MMFWWVVQTHTEFVPDEPAMIHHLMRKVQNLENPIFTSGFQKNHGDCTELTAFVCEHLYVCYIILFPRKLSAIFVILIERMNRIVSWAIALPFFRKGCASIPFLCFSSLADWVKHSETREYSEHTFMTKNQEPKSIFAIFLYLKRWLISSFYIWNMCSRNVLLKHI